MNSNISPQWNVILILIEILKIVHAPTMNKIIISYLKELIATHHKSYMKAFNVHLKPKNHIITHYSMIMEKLGLVRGIWVTRYETKHQFFKDLIRKLKNFNDVAFFLVSQDI